MAHAARFDPGMEKAVKAAGSVSALARALHRPQQTVSDRLHSGNGIWPEDVLVAERATGISRHDLRPDIYPREDGTAPHHDLEPAR